LKADSIIRSTCFVVINYYSPNFPKINPEKALTAELFQLSEQI